MYRRTVHVEAHAGGEKRLRAIDTITPTAFSLNNLLYGGWLFMFQVLAIDY